MILTITDAGEHGQANPTGWTGFSPPCRIPIVRSILLTTMLVGVAAGCAAPNPENSAACAITMMASANRVLDQMRSGAKTLSFPPDELVGTVPARVVGLGTKAAMAADGPDGTVVGYAGDGFPLEPGFGLVIVEDSAETFKGVLIFDLDPPENMPQLGTVSNVNTTLPLFGTRVSWAAVSNDRCPLFGPIDSGTRE
jgi:hypothetical protein